MRSIEPPLSQRMRAATVPRLPAPQARKNPPAEPAGQVWLALEGAD